MAQDDVASARRLYAAFAAAQTPSDVVDIAHPEVVIEEVADFPDGEVYRGHEGVLAWLRGFFEVFDEIDIEPLEYIDAADCVVVPTKQRFRSKAGLDVEWEISHVLRFRDGLLVYATGYRDHAKALAAAGLAE